MIWHSNIVIYKCSERNREWMKKFINMLSQIFAVPDGDVKNENRYAFNCGLCYRCLGGYWPFKMSSWLESFIIKTLFIFQCFFISLWRYTDWCQKESRAWKKLRWRCNKKKAMLKIVSCKVLNIVTFIQIFG